jgi:dihydroneopterin aldolase
MAVRDPPAQFDRVYVRDFVLQISIGAYRHERDRPQRVRFDVVVEVPRSSSAGDDIGKVFSYDVILDTIRALVENRHVNLVETLAEEIAAHLLLHRRVAAVTVRVEKLDIAPAVVGVEIVRRAR